MEKCPDDFAGRWFSVLHRLSLSHMIDSLKKYNIGSGQIMFLLELYYCDGINQEELSSFLNIDGANTTRALQKLEQEGYVVRKVDQEDKRAYKVYLTQKAIDIKPKIIGMMKEWESHLLVNLTDNERAQFQQILKKIGQELIGTSRCMHCMDKCSEN